MLRREKNHNYCKYYRWILIKITLNSVHFKQSSLNVYQTRHVLLTGLLFHCCSYQVLSHVHGDSSDFLAVLIDHLLDYIRKIIVFCLSDNVQELLHHWPDIRLHILLG